MSLTSNIKRSLVPLYQQHARKLHELTYIFFELTNECNLTCLHCGSDCIKDSGVPNLPAEKVLGVLVDIKSKNDPHKISVVLSGGEPLCYPHVFQLGRQITELEFPWGMVTNGYAWNQKRVRQAKESGMCSATVSLDGLADTHDWLRGRQGSYNKAVNAISLLIDENFLQAIDVITCANRRNLNQLEAIADKLVALGLKEWRIFTISPIGRATEFSDLFLSPSEYNHLLTTIRRLRERSDIAVRLSESGYLGKHHELDVRDQYFFCRAGISVAGVMVNGDILACPNIDRRFRQGNIHQDSFMDVWEHKYQVFRDRAWMRVGRCKDCGEWRNCQGNSFHLWNLDKNEPKLCHCRDYELIA